MENQTKSNEQLALAAKAGDREAAAQLWVQLVPLIAWKAQRYLGERPSVNGSTVDDFIQESFFKLMDAVRGYDPNAGVKFTSYFDKALRSAFAIAAGLRNPKVDTLNRNPVSLDMPLIAGDDDSGTLGDIIPDDNVDVSGTVLDAVQQTELERVCQEVLDQLPPEQADAIRRRYWQRESYREISEATGIDQYNARRNLEKGISKIRHTPKLKNRLDAVRLEREVDQLTGFYLTGRGAWQNRHERILEEVAIQRERQRVRFEQEWLRQQRIRRWKANGKRIDI